MKKILLTLSLFVAGFGAAFSQSTIWKPYDIQIDTSWGIRYMSAVDTSTVWAVAFDGSNGTRTSNIFVRTKNGGTTFSKGMFLPDTNLYSPSNISAVDTSIAYVSCFNKAVNAGTGVGPSVILKTTDGGTSWNIVNDTNTMYNGSTNFLDFVHFWDKNNGIALGDPSGSTVVGGANQFEIWRTNNGGTNWTRVADANIPAPASGEFGLTNCYTTYGSHIWFGTNKAHVYASADSGKTWTVNGTAIVGLTGQVEGVAFRNSLNGLAWGLSSTATTGVYNLAKTSDGGASWTAIPTATTNVNIGFNDICVVPHSNAFMSVGLNKAKSAYVTSITGDDGNTWTVLESGQTNDVRMLQVQMLDTLNGWAGCFSDTTHPLGKNGMDRYMGAKIAQACPISITASKTTVCSGDSSLLTATGVNTYTWTTIGANTSTVTVKPTTSGTFTVSGSVGTCSSVQTISVTVKASPTVTVNHPVDTLCVNGSIAITALGATTYSWSPSTGLSATTGANVTASPTVNTIYTVVGTKNTCPKAITLTVTINQNCYAGIEKISNTSNFSLYPNPSKGLVTIALSAVNTGTTLYVTDMIGKEVYKTLITDTNTSIDLSNLQKGLYMVTVANGENKHIQKLIIQ